VEWKIVSTQQCCSRKNNLVINKRVKNASQTFDTVSASTSFDAAIMAASLFVSSIYSSFASSSSVSSEDE
jgi:hypothetical protein